MSLRTEGEAISSGAVIYHSTYKNETTKSYIKGEAIRKKNKFSNTYVYRNNKI